MAGKHFVVWSLTLNFVHSTGAPKSKIQFNGVGGLRTYISFTHIEQRIAQNMNVHAQTKNRRGDLIPVTVIIAVVGTTGILNNLRPDNDSQDSGNARMITSAAVSRVGAIEIPSEPPAGRRGVSP